ncbi:polyhomeotic-like protein 1, partial [Asbolus verrucosus]
SQHYDNLQQADSQQQKQPLKDTTNTSPSTKQQKFNNNEDEQPSNQEPESTQRDPTESNNNQQASRSLQCLETLAQKAGIHDITPDDCKYDIANTLLNLDRGHDRQEASSQPSTMSEMKSQQQVAQQGQVIQTQGGQVLATAQTGSATITTMSPLQQSQAHPQQISADWSHGRVQVIQQPLQNPTYLQQVYNTQGQLLMPGNIALHPSINPQQIQVITKPFQGNQLAPHMLTTAQGKHVLQGSQAATFPGYTTIPTIPTTQNQQTLVLSQLGVISSQPNILPNHSATGNGQVAQQKQQDMHKVMAGQKVMQKVASSTGAVAQTQQQGQCVQVSQAMLGSQPTAQIISPLQPGGQPMQFAAPWQFTNGLPQVWTTNGIQSQALLAPNPIFIRGTQPDGSPGPGMFIQQSPQATTIQTQQNPTIATQGTVQQISKPRPANENIQPKQPTSRPLNILPSNTANIRPASSVSTQTIGAQTPASMGGKLGAKIRTKTPQIRTSPAPKADASNQTQIKPYTNIQQHPLGIPQQQIQMAGDRPIMPVVSMSQAGAQQVQQAIQQTIPGTLQQSLPLQPNLAVTHQPMSMGMLHSQLTQMAPHGTIIGQIQTSSQPTAMQVTASPSQVQQLQQGAPQTITISTPQQVPLPPTVPPLKIDTQSETTTADSATQGTVPVIAEAAKESTGDVAVTQPESKENIPSSDKQQSTSAESTGVQPVPIPGTVPTQPSNVTIAENGLPIATTAEEVKERCPPKAMVKPQVLTHVIEDFVIQESSEPFPVTRSALLGDLKPTQSSNDRESDEPPRKKRASSPSSNGLGMSPKGEMAKCEACGTVDLRAKFKKNKRFCSLTCAKSGKYKSDDKKHKWDKEGTMEVDVDSAASGAESSLSPNDGSEDDNTPKVDPLKWTVQEVCDFIKNLPGCSDYAEDFLIQEIDGQALMLLKEDHLMTAMAMKLGPALKIVAKIDDMRIDKEPPKQN